jgi:hypothetical protein
MGMTERKKNLQFNIVSNRSTTHGAYSTGTLNLSNLSAVLIEGDEARIDLGLLHAKSAVERGVKFTSNPDEVEGGTLYWVVWVAIDRNEKGPYYAGAAACPMRIDREKRIGWKNLADHVNRMDDARKRRIKLDCLGERERAALRKLLVSQNEEMWNNSGEELKAALAEK